MKKKQTAVDWLNKQLEQYGSPSSLNVDWETLDQLIEQAKEMEKWQMLECWEEGQLDRKIELMPNGGSALILPSDPEEGFDIYYNQTYGNG